MLYSKTYHQVLTCDDHGRIEVWDVKTGCHLYRFENVHSTGTGAMVTQYALNGEGTALFICGTDGAVSVRHPFNGELLAILDGRSDEKIGTKSSFGEPSTCMPLMLNGKSFLLVGSTLGKLAFWELPKSFSSKKYPHNFKIVYDEGALFNDNGYGAAFKEKAQFKIVPSGGH